VVVLSMIIIKNNLRNIRNSSKEYLSSATVGESNILDFWYDQEIGQFQTSTQISTRLPLNTFNRERNKRDSVLMVRKEWVMCLQLVNGAGARQRPTAIEGQTGEHQPKDSPLPKQAQHTVKHSKALITRL
jgi:hypothetical protein